MRKKKKKQNNRIQSEAQAFCRIQNESKCMSKFILKMCKTRVRISEKNAKASNSFCNQQSENKKTTTTTKKKTGKKTNK